MLGLGIVIPKELCDLPANVRLKIIDEITPQFSQIARAEGKLGKAYTAAISELWRTNKIEDFKGRYGSRDVEISIKPL